MTVEAGAHVGQFRRETVQKPITDVALDNLITFASRRPRLAFIFNTISEFNTYAAELNSRNAAALKLTVDRLLHPEAPKQPQYGDQIILPGEARHQASLSNPIDAMI